jgi:AraC-like DNA-binding protein
MVELDQAGCLAVQQRALPPPPDLASIVELVWITEWPGSAQAASWRIVPDPCAHILVQVSERRARAMFVGARSVHTDVDVSNRRLTVGVRLRSGLLRPLARVDAPELTDRALPTGDVFGRRGCALAARVSATDDPHLILRHLVEFLRTEAARGPAAPDARVIAAARLIERRRGLVSVDDLARHTGVAVRTLRSALRDQVGIGPNRFKRIQRLYHALQLSLTRPTGRLARTAAETGYADQSHLVREFRALLGETPTEFLARR